MTKSQWECLLQNVGEWQGSFTRLSSRGTVLEDTPTVVSLIGQDENKTMRQTICRLTTPPDETVLEYRTLGRGVLLFENGAFSQGSIQLAPFTEFGAEFGLIEGDRRMRLVHLFNKENQLSQFTLIREHLPNSPTPERPPLTVEALLGTWHGEAVTVYPDWRNPTTMSTSLTVSRTGDRLLQSLSFSTETGKQTLTSEAQIAGQILTFIAGAYPMQVLLLPDGASATSPICLPSRQSFFLETGWLLQPGLRQRMIRRYSDRGEWVNLTLVTERLERRG